MGAPALIAALFSLYLVAAPAGADLNGPVHAWFEAQHSISGAWCCNLSDGHLLEDTDWRQDGKGYQVHIEGEWLAIPDTALRDPRGGPNPTGKAIVWYTTGVYGTHIYCFAPGFQG